MKNFKLWVFLAAVPLSGFAQDLQANAVIPLDPAVKTGKLKNGLTYYIRKNAKPENKVDLRLVITEEKDLNKYKEGELMDYKKTSRRTACG
ncbi:hypothetical protein HYN59_06970 [Flavobacterium album]|uniref:Uncharacterized protein n=1 Tax=Flavobacterium album TaxID=2175091 RepID=A0A2S1QXC0_9FLAO|nr:hypothetical protein [Flavobacterium album]AWH84881.1 hypothetical protein HYN59_06970 [Flavobacterium album]